MSATLVAFVDRDGTLIEEPDDFQVDAIDKVRLKPGVMSALAQLRDAGYRLVMVSNQDGLGTESFPQADFEGPHDFVTELFASQDIRFDEVFICPHLDEDGCDCRKPRTGLLTAYLAANQIDLARSCVIGDRETDLELARNLGTRGFLLDDAQGWSQVTRAILRGVRRASSVRRTNETAVEITVDLDASGPVRVSTGVGFFDHMLEQVGQHAGIALDIACEGDLHVDPHHTVEDVGLVLGEAIRNALGPKTGIARYGFVLPMDEAQARVAIDLSGRPYSVFRGDLPAAAVGELPTELVPHFFRSLAVTLGAAVQVEVDGEDTHHMVEACFKGLGRCLGQAVGRAGTGVPSTKGVL